MTHHTGSDEGRLSDLERLAAAVNVGRLTWVGGGDGDFDLHLARAILPTLAARAAAPDALRERVEALSFGEAASAVLNGVVGTTPDTYSGVTKDEALDYATELVADLRAAVADPTDGATTCDHEWHDRGEGQDEWRECWLCGKQEDR